MMGGMYNRGNTDTNSYWDAMNKSQAGSNAYAETQALTDAAQQQAQNADPNADPSNPGLAMAQAQQRAALMRQYADLAGANQEIQHASQLGLQQAQTQNETAIAGKNQLGLTQATDAEASSQKAAQITAQVSSQLQGLTNPDGTPRQPTQQELLDNQRQLADALQSNGFVNQGNEVRQNLAKVVTTQVAADTNQRKADGALALSQLQLGNVQPALDFTKRYSYGSPSGIDDIQPGPQPGSYAVTLNLNGQPQKKVVDAATLTDRLSKGIGLLVSPDASKYIADQQHLQAQTAQAKAAAGASNAAAGASSARANALNTDTQRAQQVWNARVQNGMPGPQTDANQAIVQAANSAAQAKLASPGAAKTPWLMSTDANNGAQMMVNRATGESFKLDPKQGWVSQGIPGKTPPAAPGGAPAASGPRYTWAGPGKGIVLQQPPTAPTAP